VAAAWEGAGQGGPREGAMHGFGWKLLRRGGEAGMQGAGSCHVRHGPRAAEGDCFTPQDIALRDHGLQSLCSQRVWVSSRRNSPCAPAPCPPTAVEAARVHQAPGACQQVLLRVGVVQVEGGHGERAQFRAGA
jgi:hypothetical protein